MTVNKYVRGVELILKRNKLQQKEELLSNKITTLFGNIVDWNKEVREGKSTVLMMIPLVEYLNMYPNAKPMFKTHDMDDGIYGVMEYPEKFVGTTRGGMVSVFIRTETQAARVSSVCTNQGG